MASPDKKRGRTGGFSLAIHATDQAAEKKEEHH
jgi:hypothetical protein